MNSLRNRFRNPAAEPLFNSRDLIHLILPFIAGFVMSLLVGMLDTAMVSTVGEHAVSGVSLVDNLIQVVVFVFMAFGTGGAVVAGQYLGNRDAKQACDSTEQLLMLAGTVSALAMILLFLARRSIITLVFGSITDEVNTEVQIYLGITVFSIPAMALYEAELASFRAMGEARITMYLSLMMNLINVIGNALLIFVFHMGTAGVAWPTLVSRWAAALMAFVLLLDQRRPLHLRPGQGFRLRGDLIGKILRVGLPNGVENGIFQLGKLITLSIITGFGTQAIAANAIAVILTNIISVPGWGINQTTMTVIARCVGAEEYEQAKFYNRLLLDITRIAITIWGLIIILSLPLILPIFHLSAEAAAIARWMVIIHAVGSVFVWGQAFMTPTAMRASGDATFAMVISIASMWIFRVGLAWILSRTTGLGALSVWTAMDIDWLCRAIIYSIYWKRGRWMKKRVV